MSQPTNTPSLEGAPGWSLLDVPDILVTEGTFLSGEPEGDRLRVRHFVAEDGTTVIAKVWFGPRTEGPPGHVHGGAMAAIMDEIMGLACWHNQLVVVAANLSFDYRNMLPLRSETEVEARIIKVEDRKVHTKSVLRLPDGTVVTEGRGLFIDVKAKLLANHGRSE